MAKKMELLFFAKTLVQPSFLMFYDVLRCFFRFQPSLTTISNVCFRCNHRNDFLRLFPMVAIVVANDHRQRSFAQVYCIPLHSPAFTSIHFHSFSFSCILLHSLSFTCIPLYSHSVNDTTSPPNTRAHTAV